MFQQYLCPLPFKTEDIMNNIDLVKLSAVKVANLSPLFLQNGQAGEAESIGAAASSCLHVPLVLSNKAAFKISNECILMSMGRQQGTLGVFHVNSVDKVILCSSLR